MLKPLPGAQTEIGGSPVCRAFNGLSDDDHSPSFKRICREELQDF
jgi:hypothetical protein